MRHSQLVKEAYQKQRLNGDCRWGISKDGNRKSSAIARSKNAALALQHNQKIQNICSELDAAGYKTITAKAKRLNELNILSRRNQIWSRQSLRRILKYPTKTLDDH